MTSHPDEPVSTLAAADIAELDVAIIGAGAAGLMAAIFAGRTDQARRAASPDPSSTKPLRIAALDGAARVGAKILVAGGGRCNVTHDVITPDDFNGGQPRSITRVLRSFDVAKTVDFFADLGVELKREETGKLFPVTDSAKTVLDALLRAVEAAGAEVWAGCRVTGVEIVGDRIAIDHARGRTLAKTLILATGGLALPKTGSDGAGYGMAEALGHTRTTTTPALVPLVLPEGHWITKLSGLSAPAELRVLAAGGKVLRKQRGPLLLTHFGISGPAAMDISRHWIAAHAADPASMLTLSLAPDEDFAAMERWWLETAEAHPRGNVAAALRQRFPERLARSLVAYGAAIDPETSLGQLSREARRALVHAMTALPLPVERDRGYTFAEVTAGGVPLEEIDPATMASRRREGLFLCGEILDVDGRIGGYNFQWAWCSGRLAGIHAAKRAAGPVGA
ncbi:MAG: aminoacetone oxidase family FAD-binding enzyme [Planctomycetota bacterium]|nr:aminoacetone oxidase family FAD-binding enzyme [Planctomycetota bacterium]